jgi:hypothetical protein
MEPGKKFMEYAIAFEKTFADDDWARLEPCFAEDAVYTVTGGPPLGGRFEGREKLLEQLRNSVDELDRKFAVRRVELVGTPKTGDDWFEIGWRATYEKPGCPDLVFEGVERATFLGERIVLLEDTIEPEAGQRIKEYQSRYFC